MTSHIHPFTCSPTPSSLPTPLPPSLQFSSFCLPISPPSPPLPAPIHSLLKFYATSEVSCNVGHTVCAADDKSGSNCSKELTKWNKVNFQMGGVTLAGQLDVSQASAAEQRQLQQSGIQVSALQKAPCSLQVALLPFGEKDEPLLFTGRPCKLIVDWQSSLLFLTLDIGLLPNLGEEEETE